MCVLTLRTLKLFLTGRLQLLSGFLSKSSFTEGARELITKPRPLAVIRNRRLNSFGRASFWPDHSIPSLKSIQHQKQINASAWGFAVDYATVRPCDQAHASDQQ